MMKDSVKEENTTESTSEDKANTYAIIEQGESEKKKVPVVIEPPTKAGKAEQSLPSLATMQSSTALAPSLNSSAPALDSELSSLTPASASAPPAMAMDPPLSSPAPAPEVVSYLSSPAPSQAPAASPSLSSPAPVQVSASAVVSSLSSPAPAASPTLSSPALARSSTHSISPMRKVTPSIKVINIYLRIISNLNLRTISNDDIFY